MRFACLVLGCLVGWSSPLYAVMFKRTNEKGKISYQERPCAGSDQSERAILTPEDRLYQVDRSDIQWVLDSILGLDERFAQADEAIRIKEKKRIMSVVRQQLKDNYLYQHGDLKEKDERIRKALDSIHHEAQAEAEKIWREKQRVEAKRQRVEAKRQLEQYRQAAIARGRYFFRANPVNKTSCDVFFVTDEEGQRSMGSALKATCQREIVNKDLTLFTCTGKVVTRVYVTTTREQCEAYRAKML